MPRHELWDGQGNLVEVHEPAAEEAAQAVETAKQRRVDRLDVVALRGLFNHENRIRVLEGKGPVTAEQFKNAIKGLL
jgi:hypothetical protein